jgi:hypothetical protein
MMVITHGYLVGILVSLVAVDRIKDAHQTAVLEDKQKEKGMQYLLESYVQHLTNNFIEREEQLRKRQLKQHHDGGRGAVPSWFRFFSFLRPGLRPRLESRPNPTSSGSKNAGKVKVNEIGMSCVISSST